MYKPFFFLSSTKASSWSPKIFWGCFGWEVTVQSTSCLTSRTRGSELMGAFCCRPDSPCGSAEERSGLLKDDSTAKVPTGETVVVGTCGPESDDKVAMRWDSGDSTQQCLLAESPHKTFYVSWYKWQSFQLCSLTPLRHLSSLSSVIMDFNTGLKSLQAENRHRWVDKITVTLTFPLEVCVICTKQ